MHTKFLWINVKCKLRGILTTMTQERALDILKTGANVFLTGEPGAGKTHVINQYIAWLEAAQLNVAVAASTGIAATHIGGMTIHSWSGIGIKDFLSAKNLEYFWDLFLVLHSYSDSSYFCRFASVMIICSPFCK